MVEVTAMARDIRELWEDFCHSASEKAAESPLVVGLVVFLACTFDLLVLVAIHLLGQN